MNRLVKTAVLFVVMILFSSCSQDNTYYSDLSAIPFASADETTTGYSETIRSDTSSEYYNDVEYDETAGHIVGTIGEGIGINVNALIMPSELPDSLNIYRVDNRIDYNNLYEFEDGIVDSAGDGWFGAILNDIYYVWGAESYFDENGNEIMTTDEKITEYMDSFEYVDIRSGKTVNEIVDVLPDDIEYADYMLHYVLPDQEGYKYDLRDMRDFDNVTDYGNGSLDYYVIRPSVNNIPIGTTQDSMMAGPLGGCFVMMDGAQPENSRYSNGECVVDVWNDNLNNYEMIRSGLPIIPIQDCLGNAMEYFGEFGFSSDTRVYGIELIYVQVKECLPTGEVSLNGDMYRHVILYPVWAIYYQTLMGTHSQSRGFVFIDAVNGEYSFSVSSYLCSVAEDEFTHSN